MSDDGPMFGGDVNRPASRPEIRKLPRYRCERCMFVGPEAMVARIDGVRRCVNQAACDRRRNRPANATAP